LNHAFEKFKISCLQTSKLRPVYIQLDIQIDVSRISHFDVIRSDIWIIAGCPRDITLDVEFVCQSIFWISKGYICATWEEEIRKKDLKSKSRMKENADKKAKHRELKEGDSVLLRRDKLANKLQAPFDPSPYRITEVKKSMITAERNNKKVTRNVTFFKKIERKDDYEESEESEESEDEYYHNALENANFPEQIQVPVQNAPQQNEPVEPVEEPEIVDDAPTAGVQLPVEGRQASVGDTVEQTRSSCQACNREARMRLLEALVRNPPPNELVRPRTVLSEPTSPEESTRPKRDRQPPKRLDDFVVNLFNSKKGK